MQNVSVIRFWILSYVYVLSVFRQFQIRLQVNWTVHDILKLTDNLAASSI